MIAKKIFSDSLVYGSGKVLNSLILILTLPYFTRVFSPSSFGILDITLTASLFLGHLIGANLTASYNYYFHDKKNSFSESQLFRTIFYFYLTWGSLLLLTACLAVYFLNFYFWRVDFLMILYALVGAYLAQFLALISNYFRMHHAPKRYVIVSAVSTLFGTAMAIALITLFGSELVYYFLGLGVGKLLAVLYGLRSISLPVMKVPENAWKHTKILLLFSLPLLPSVFSQYLLDFSDRWILGYLVDTTAVGIYAVGVKVASFAQIGSGILMFAFLPYSMKMIQNSLEVASQELEKILRIISAVLCCGVLLIAFLAPFLVGILGAPEYYKGYIVVGVLSFSYVFFSYTYFSTLGSWKAEKTASYSVITFGGVLVNIALNFLLIPYYGILAAAFTTLFSMGMIVVFSFVYSHRCWPIQFSYKTLVLTNIITMAALSVILLSQFFYEDFLVLPALAGAGGCFFVLLLNIRKSEVLNLSLILKKRQGL